MNNVFYEESGSFKIGRILQENEGSLQIEDIRGKRSKLKRQSVWLRFNETLEQFLEKAHELTESVDLDLLWETIEEESIFSFEEIATTYFGTKASSLEKAAIAIKLFIAPMYFYRKGQGQFKAAPKAALEAALLGQKKRQEGLVKIANWRTDLERGDIPEAFQTHLSSLLHRPDKNSLEYKALSEAAQALHTTPLLLLQKNGGIPDIEAYFLEGFLLEAFTQGVDFTPDESLHLPNNLPKASTPAFSIDDSNTTEIDDAFSLTQLPEGKYRLGIHIAVPTLGILPNSILEKTIRERLSTVYMPGNKITMLPEDVIQHFSLAAGEDIPALSLYIDVNAEFEAEAFETKLELVPIADNLRIETLHTDFNQENITSPDSPNFPYKSELLWLWRYAKKLEEKRTQAQSPLTSTRVDYIFHIDIDEALKKHVRIEPRARGTPIDTLVSELMILANSQWAAQLKDANIAAIYRTQNNGKVRMSLNPAPHTGLGVEQYTWLTSPLRRSIDFFNQQQLLAHVLGFKPRFMANDANLFSIITTFESTNSLYQDFQQKMERYWCLRYIDQEALKEFSATLVKENLVRFNHLPFYLRLNELPTLEVGAIIKLQLIKLDYLTLNIECRVISHD